MQGIKKEKKKRETYTKTSTQKKNTLDPPGYHQCSCKGDQCQEADVHNSLLGLSRVSAPPQCRPPRGRSPGWIHASPGYAQLYAAAASHGEPRSWAGSWFVRLCPVDRVDGTVSIFNQAWSHFLFLLKFLIHYQKQGDYLHARISYKAFPLWYFPGCS